MPHLAIAGPLVEVRAHRIEPIVPGDPLVAIELADQHESARGTFDHLRRIPRASLAGPSRFSNLQELVIATYPDATFDALAGLASLRLLHIVHLPKISDLRCRR